MKNLNPMRIIQKPINLIMIIICFSFVTACGQTAKKVEEVKIKTSAMCGMCKERIEKNMAFEKGVTAVNLDVETKIVTISYKPSKTNVEALCKAISKIGYDANDVLADKEAYDKLPSCCKKDAAAH